MTVYHNETPIETMTPIGFTAQLLSRKVKLNVNGVATITSVGNLFSSVTCNQQCQLTYSSMLNDTIIISATGKVSQSFEFTSPFTTEKNITLVNSAQNRITTVNVKLSTTLSASDFVVKINSKKATLADGMFSTKFYEQTDIITQDTVISVVYKDLTVQAVTTKVSVTQFVTNNFTIAVSSTEKLNSFMANITMFKADCNSTKSIVTMFKVFGQVELSALGCTPVF